MSDSTAPPRATEHDDLPRAADAALEAVGEEAQARAAHVLVADSIRGWIALGRLGPGDRLPTERELAERLGVGRVTIRQAIRMLDDEGLVATRRGRSGGTFVLDDAERPQRTIEITAELLAEVHENFEFRMGIEPLAARLAAERAEDMERWAIRGLAEGEPASVRAFRTLDSRFHLAIVHASRNKLLIEAVSRSRTEFFRWADVAWEQVDWARLPPRERDFGRHHRPMAEAIELGDGELAASRTMDHLVAGEKQFHAIIEFVQSQRG